MLYIKNRFDRNGNIINNPENYIPQHPEELQEFLTQVYANTNDCGNFDQKIS